MAGVYARACTDRKFLNALLKNPDQAIEKAAIRVSKGDRANLAKLLGTKVEMNLSDLLKYLNKFYVNSIEKGTIPPPPPPPWDPLKKQKVLPEISTQLTEPKIEE